MPMTSEQVIQWALAHGFRDDGGSLICAHGGRTVRLTPLKTAFRVDVEDPGTRPRRVGGARYSSPWLSLDPDTGVIRGAALWSPWSGGFVAGLTDDLPPWLEPARDRLMAKRARIDAAVSAAASHGI